MYLYLQIHPYLECSIEYTFENSDGSPDLDSIPNPHYFPSLLYDDFLDIFKPEPNTSSLYIPGTSWSRSDEKEYKTDRWEERNDGWRYRHREAWKQSRYKRFLECRDRWRYARDESLEYRAQNKEEEEPLPGEARYRGPEVYEEEHEENSETQSRDEDTIQDDESNFELVQGNDEWDIEAALEHESLPHYFFLCPLPLITDRFEQILFTL
jgi:hypothetical protein